MLGGLRERERGKKLRLRETLVQIEKKVAVSIGMYRRRLQELQRLFDGSVLGVLPADTLK